MSRIKIIPAPLSGTLVIPPSKSIYHRALILAALSEKGGRVRPFFTSDDIDATAAVLQALGAHIEQNRAHNAYLVYPVGARGQKAGLAPAADANGHAPAAAGRISAAGTSAGTKDRLASIDQTDAVPKRTDTPVETAAKMPTPAPCEPDQTGRGKAGSLLEPVMDCKESGSTVRFLIPIAAALGKSCTFTGSGRLPQRPLTPYFPLLRAHGVDIERLGAADLPLQVCGQLESGTFSLPGDISSQYITGLLLACALLPGESRIHLSSSLQSAPYVDITRDLLEDYGVETDWDGADFIIRGGQRILSRDYTVESDWSQAAFFFMAGVLGATLSLSGLREDSRQGDKRIAEIAVQFGAGVHWAHGVCHITPPAGAISPVHIADASDIPDIIPTIAAAAAFADGVSVIEQCGRLRIKESDRLAATIANIRAIGGFAHSEGDTLYITGRSALPGGRVDTFGDHRMAMAFAIAATRCAGEVVMDAAQAVRKSYPAFWDDFSALGGQIHELID